MAKRRLGHYQQVQGRRNALHHALDENLNLVDLDFAQTFKRVKAYKGLSDDEAFSDSSDPESSPETSNTDRERRDATSSSAIAGHDYEDISDSEASLCPNQN